MTNLSSALRAMREPQRPGTLKSVLAGLAIAWGTRTFSTQAMDATERRDAANAELETLRLEIEDAHALLSERLTGAIRDGYCDPQVKARAAALGWVEADPIATEHITVYAPTGVSDSGYYESVDTDALQDASDAQRDAGD